MRPVQHRRYRSLAACIAALLFAGAAESVVISSGNGTGNTTPPADDFGFENVGVTDTGLGGVYLGDGWVLTCSGDGWTRAETLITWNQFWQQGVPPPVYHGYVPQSAAARRWGTNLVTTAGSDVEIGNPPESATRAIQMLFDEAGGTPHEFQAVVGDSGGACFAKRGSTWELVGVMFAILLLPNQPVGSAVFGNSTYAADVAFYRAQIEALTPAQGPIPALPAIGAAAVAALVALTARRLRAARS